MDEKGEPNVLHAAENEGSQGFCPSIVVKKQANHSRRQGRRFGHHMLLENRLTNLA